MKENIEKLKILLKRVGKESELAEIENTLGGTISLGIGRFERMDTDNWDNGTYIIEGWDIKERLYKQYEDAQMKDSMFENLKYINEKQPQDEQLKEEELKAFAELWEIKHIDRLNDERKAYVEDKIRKQKQEEKESTTNEQKEEKSNDEKEHDSIVSDKKGQFMTKAEFIAMFSKEFDKDTQQPTGENEVKEQNKVYKGDDEIDR